MGEAKGGRGSTAGVAIWATLPNARGFVKAVIRLTKRFLGEILAPPDHVISG